MQTETLVTVLTKVTSDLQAEENSYPVARVLVENKTEKIDTVEALVSGHPRDAKKVSVTGAGRLPEWFS